MAMRTLEWRIGVGVLRRERGSMDRTPIVHKKETLKRCAALGVETGLRGCPLLAYGLWLWRNHAWGHRQDCFARCDHGAIGDLNGGVAVVFGKDHHAGLTAHSAEQCPALLGVLLEKKSVGDDRILAHIKRDFTNPCVP